MAKWTVNRVGDRLTLQYIDRNGVQDCGNCHVDERQELMNWMYGSGDGVDLADVVVIEGRSFYNQFKMGEA